MYINYKGKKYYWDIDRMKENLFNAAMFVGAIACYIIAGML